MSRLLHNFGAVSYLAYRFPGSVESENTGFSLDSVAGLFPKKSHEYLYKKTKDSINLIQKSDTHTYHYCFLLQLMVRHRYPGNNSAHIHLQGCSNSDAPT